MLIHMYLFYSMQNAVDAVAHKDFYDKTNRNRY